MAYNSNIINDWHGAALDVARNRTFNGFLHDGQAFNHAIQKISKWLTKADNPRDEDFRIYLGECGDQFLDVILSDQRAEKIDGNYGVIIKDALKEALKEARSQHTGNPNPVPPKFDLAA